MDYLDLRAQYASMRDDINDAIKRVAESQVFINGPEGKKLEEEIASYCKTEYAVGLNSGTDALKLALQALKIGPDDEVITTPFTFIATAEMIVEVGAKPVFVDVDDSLNLNPSLLRDAITERTRAIIPVHLFGLPADLDEIEDAIGGYDIALIEDAAQAIGAEYRGRKVGGIGTIGCFSFFPAKNLGAWGDAGMVVTNDQELAKQVRLMRNHGSEKKYLHQIHGCSSRLDEIQAAILRAKLPHVDEWNKRRQVIAGVYSTNLHDLQGVLFTPVPMPFNKTCVFQQYTIRVERRDELIKHLRELNIPTAVHYPRPLHLQPAFAHLGYKEGDFPIAEMASREVVSLPCYAELPTPDLHQVIKGIRTFYTSHVHATERA